MSGWVKTHFFLPCLPSVIKGSQERIHSDKINGYKTSIHQEDTSKGSLNVFVDFVEHLKRTTVLESHLHWFSLSSSPSLQILVKRWQGENRWSTKDYLSLFYDRNEFALVYLNFWSFFVCSWITGLKRWGLVSASECPTQNPFPPRRIPIRCYFRIR